MADESASVTVTLHVCSPCEHDVDLGVLELPLGSQFTHPKCVDSRGRRREHVVTTWAYPEKKRRR